MTLFGKLLVFVNLLVGGAFAYFAMQSYFGEKGKGNGRQAITAAMLRHIILVQGLPIGGEKGVAPESGKAAAELDDVLDMPSDPEAEIPFKVVMGGGYRTDTVSKPLLESFFKALGDGGPLAPGASGNPVPNQLGELKRVRAKVEELLKKAETPPEKLALLSRWLLFQSETFEERLAIQTMTSDKNPDGTAKTPEQLAKNAEELEKKLYAKFTVLLDAPKPANITFLSEPLPDLAALTDELARLKASKAAPTEIDAKEKEVSDAEAKVKERAAKIAESRANPQDGGERRLKIAHLLVHLSQDALWQKRVMVIVGLRRFVAVIATQAERFRDMATRVEMLIMADQLAFVAAERNFIRLAIDRTQMAETQAALKLKWAEQKRKEDDFVSQRTTQLNSIKAQLKKMKAEVDELLVKQSNIETNLFEVQREVAVTLDEVYLLEIQLAARERDLLGLPPKAIGGGK